MRAVSLYLPRWPVDLVKRRWRQQQAAGTSAASAPSPPSPARPSPEPAWLIVSTSGDRQSVVCCCRQALAAGAAPGMTAAHAYALLGPGRVQVAPHTPQRDAQALRDLARWCSRYSPTVAVDPPDGLLMDITGSERLFQGEDRLLQQIADELQNLGLEARIAAAPSFGAAWALAHHSPSLLTVADDDNLLDLLAPLPPAALRIDPDTQDDLQALGVDQIHHLLQLPREELPSRYGDALLLRLDQALGRIAETIDPVRPDPPATVEQRFDGPVKQYEAIEQTLQQLAEKVTRLLHQQEAGVLELTITLTRSDIQPLTFKITLSRPSRDPQHLWSLIRPHAEKAHLGFGVDAVTMRATHTRRLPHEQSRWVGAAHPDGADHAGVGADAAVGVMLDTLANRLGSHAVLRCQPRASHLPEASFTFASVLEPHAKAPPPMTPPALIAQAAPTPKAKPNAKAMDAAAPFAVPELAPNPTTHPRPTCLLPRPCLVDVMSMTPDGPLIQLTWRSQTVRVIRTVGPERIAMPWWQTDRPHATRDYFKIQDDQNRWLWVFRVADDRRWYVHGLWA